MSNKSDNRILAREQHPLPRTVAGISTLVRELLSDGGPCQRLVIEQGHPIRVWRWVDEDPMEEVKLDLDGALRNAEIIEYTNPNEDKSPEQVLFHMMHLLRGEKAYPVCWVTGSSLQLLRRWLQFEEYGLPGDPTEVLGVPVKNVELLPDETLILAGAQFVDGDVRDIKVAVKTAMEVREKKDGKVVDGDVDRVGDHPRGDGASNGALAGDPGGDGLSNWSPSRFLRERLNGSGHVR